MASTEEAIKNLRYWVEDVRLKEKALKESVHIMSERAEELITAVVSEKARSK